jgi:phage-related protein
MATLGFKFGSYSFTGTNALISDFEVKGGTRQQSQVIPMKDGALITEAQLSPLAVTLKGTLVGSSSGHLRQQKDNFLKAMLIGTQPLYIWDDRYVTAQVKELNYDYKAAMSFMPFQISFQAGTPFWVAASATTSQLTTGATTPTSYTINASGSAPGRPAVYFIANAAGTLSTISYENSTTGQSFAYQGMVALNSTLCIDCQAMTITQDGADVVGSFSGDFIKLMNGANAMTYSGGACTVRVSWNERYY